MAFHTAQWSNQCNMMRQMASSFDMDQIATLTAHMATLTNQLAVANLTSGVVPILEEPYSRIEPYENPPYGTPMNAMDHVAYFQPQPMEKKPSLEDLISTFVMESQARSTWNEERLDSIEMHMGTINASINSMESQIGRLATVVYNANKGTKEVIERDVELEESTNEAVSSEAESLVEEDEPTLELEPVTNSQRHEIVGIASCCPMISSFSFAGVEEEQPRKVHDHDVEVDTFKGIKLHNEDRKSFKMVGVDQTSEESSERSMSNSENTEVLDQCGAPEKSHQIIPNLKEPEHRKAKLHWVDEENKKSG